MTKKFTKVGVFGGAQLLGYFRPDVATKVLVQFYVANGMIVEGDGPTYVASGSWFDGTDYSLITLGDGCLVSNEVRILTHDWSPNTLLSGLGAQLKSPAGRVLPVRVGAGTFVGMGAILMPGASIGEHCLVGAGSVVRGEIPDHSVVVGNPGEVIGDVRDYLERRFPSHSLKITEP